MNYGSCTALSRILIHIQHTVRVCISDFICVIVYLMRLLQSSFPYEYFQFGSDQCIGAVSYPSPGSNWIPPVPVVQRAHHK